MFSLFKKGHHIPNQFLHRFQVYEPIQHRLTKPTLNKNTPRMQQEGQSATTLESIKPSRLESPKAPPATPADNSLTELKKSSRSKFYSKESLTSAYYSSAIFGLIAGTTYSVANGKAKKELEDIQKKFFPPEYLGTITNVPREGAMVYHSFYPSNLKGKIDKALSVHKNCKAPNYVLLSGEAGIGKYSLILKVAGDLAKASNSTTSTIFSIDAWSEQSINDGHRELARELGLKKENASNQEVNKFISSQISKRDQTILIYRCFREKDKLPSDSIFNNNSGDFSKAIVLLSTGLENVLNLANNRRIPVVTLTNSVSAQDLIDYYKDQNPNKTRLLEVMQPAGRELIEIFNGNPRLVAQSVAILENHPEMSLFDLKQRITTPNPEASLAQLSLLLAQKESNSPKDLADILKIISSNKLNEGIAWSELKTAFVSMNKPKQDNNAIDLRLNKASILLNKYDLITYSAVEDKIYGRFLQKTQLEYFLNPDKELTKNTKRFSFSPTF